MNDGGADEQLLRPPRQKRNSRQNEEDEENDEEEADFSSLEAGGSQAAATAKREKKQQLSSSSSITLDQATGVVTANVPALLLEWKPGVIDDDWDKNAASKSGKVAAGKSGKVAGGNGGGYGITGWLTRSHAKDCDVLCFKAVAKMALHQAAEKMEETKSQELVISNDIFGILSDYSNTTSNDTTTSSGGDRAVLLVVDLQRFLRLECGLENITEEDLTVLLSFQAQQLRSVSSGGDDDNNATSNSNSKIKKQQKRRRSKALANRWEDKPENDNVANSDAANGVNGDDASDSDGDDDVYDSDGGNFGYFQKEDSDDDDSDDEDPLSPSSPPSKINSNKSFSPTDLRHSLGLPTHLAIRNLLFEVCCFVFLDPSFIFLRPLTLLSDPPPPLCSHFSLLLSQNSLRGVVVFCTS
jgi:hypothetical protein